MKRNIIWATVCLALFAGSIYLILRFILTENTTAGILYLTLLSGAYLCSVVAVLEDTPFGDRIADMFAGEEDDYE